MAASVRTDVPLPDSASSDDDPSGDIRTEEGTGNASNENEW